MNIEDIQKLFENWDVNIETDEKGELFFCYHDHHDFVFEDSGNVLYDINEILNENGLYLDDIYIDNDSVGGFIKTFK